MGIKEVFKNMGEKGIKFPYAYDPVTKKASITLLFPYLMGIIAVSGHIALFFKESLMEAVIAADIFWSICMVFYRLRKLDKIKFDLDDKSIEINGNKSSESEGDEEF